MKTDDIVEFVRLPLKMVIAGIEIIILYLGMG